MNTYKLSTCKREVNMHKIILRDLKQIIKWVKLEYKDFTPDDRSYKYIQILTRHHVLDDEERAAYRELAIEFDLNFG